MYFDIFYPALIPQDIATSQLCHPWPSVRKRRMKNPKLDRDLGRDGWCAIYEFQGMLQRHGSNKSGKKKACDTKIQQTALLWCWRSNPPKKASCLLGFRYKRYQKAMLQPKKIDGTGVVASDHFSIFCKQPVLCKYGLLRFCCLLIQWSSYKL